MWEWREDTRPGGWRLDAAGTWTWGAVPPHRWVDEPTPIFRAVASDWERHGREHVAGHRIVGDTARERGHLPTLPEPRPGSGPLPIQRPQDPGRRRELTSVEATPPPLPQGGSEDEPRRRAKHRRPPQAAPPSAGGRHALQPREEDAGHHMLGLLALTPRT